MDLIFFIFGDGCTFGFCCCYFFNKKKTTTLRSCRTCMIDKTPLMPTHIKNCDKITEHKYLLLEYKEECLAKVKKNSDRDISCYLEIWLKTSGGRFHSRKILRVKFPDDKCVIKCPDDGFIMKFRTCFYHEFV